MDLTKTPDSRPEVDAGTEVGHGELDEDGDRQNELEHSSDLDDSSLQQTAYASVIVIGIISVLSILVLALTVFLVCILLN